MRREVQNVSVLVAVGVNDEGYREILGVAEGCREDKESWSDFLRYLKERGLKGIRLIQCLGLYEIIGDFFPEAKWQRCIVHWYRNAFTMCPWKHLREVVAMLKAIHAQEDKAATRQKAALVTENLRAMKLEKIVGFVNNIYGLFPSFPFQRFIRHSPEFLRGCVFQDLKEPISNLLFFLLHRRNTFCRFRCGECRHSKSG